MADITYTGQVIREAPEIEALKVGLLDAARQQIAEPLTLPAYEAATMGQGQLAALDLGAQYYNAGQGIGGYAPFLGAGAEALTQGQQLQQYGAEAAGAVDVSPYFASGEQALGTGYAAGLGATGQFDPSAAVPQFMNPYQQQVIDESLRQIQRQNALQQQQAASQAVKSGAFGSTREGVQRAELGRALAEQQNQAIVGGLQQGYGQALAAAQQAFEAQQNRQLQAGQLFGQLGSQYGALGQAQGQLGLQQAQTLGTLGTNLGQLGASMGAMGQTAQQMGTADIDLLAKLGQMEQQQEQNRLEAWRATQLQESMSPYQQLGFLSDIYKGAPSSQSTLTTTSAPSTSPLMQAVGLGISGLAAATGASKAGLF